MLHFANRRLEVLAPGDMPFEVFQSLGSADYIRVRDALLTRLELIDEFADENPANWSADDLKLVRSWRHLVAGRFTILQEQKAHAILLSSTEPPVAYGVLALSNPLGEIIEQNWPVYCQAVLLPFRSRIIYDGLMNRFPISFGRGFRAGLKEDFQRAKSAGGIVTSLPRNARPEPPGAKSKAKLVAKSL